MNRYRLFFAMLPPPQVVEAIYALVRDHGLDKRLGRAFFAPTNWHQSLSERIWSPTDADCASLLKVGDSVRAHACTLSFNKITSGTNQDGKIHWTLRATHKNTGFDTLKHGVQSVLKVAGHNDIATGVTPHITLSYWARELLDTIEVAPTIDWTLNELLLVIGGGDPYHYNVIGRWPLLPEIDPPQVQLGMF